MKLNETLELLYVDKSVNMLIWINETFWEPLAPYLCRQFEDAVECSRGVPEGHKGL
jgi:hypothetical protein